jgi:Uncharacterized conserved protein
MKKFKKISQVILVLTFTATLFSCKKLPEEIPEDETRTFDIWVLNEGLIDMNNSSITAYNILTKDKVSNLYRHANNNRQLGDLANDMLLYGSKVYIAVNGSNLIDVLDANNGVSLKQIKAEASQPRSIVSHDGKIYVCYFDGNVAKIDTSSFQVERLVKVGRNPDGICVANNKLYVSNSGGMDYPNYDNTVSVIDLNSFSEIKKIIVGDNPTLIKSNKNGDVYVVSNGNYADISPCLQRINSSSDVVEKVYGMEVTGFDIYNNSFYFYTNNYMSGSIVYQILDLSKDSIVNSNMISGSSLPTTPYNITINPKNGDIYITDALDYTSTGDVYCFGQNGQKKFQFEAGILPNKIIFR